MHPTEQSSNKNAVRGFIEEFYGKHDRSAYDRYHSPRLVDHSTPPGVEHGFEGAKRVAQGSLDAFPDMSVTIEDMVAEGDKVVVRATYSGTQLVEYTGTPSSGRRFAMQAIDIVRVEDGMIVERWGVDDTITMLRQLGVVRETDQAA